MKLKVNGLLFLFLLISSSVSLVSFADESQGVSAEHVILHDLNLDQQAQIQTQFKEAGIPASTLQTAEVTTDAEHGTLLVTGTTGEERLEHLVYIGAQLSFLIPYGVNAQYMLKMHGEPVATAAVNGEFSRQMQFYSVNASVHPFSIAGFSNFSSHLFLGTQVGLYQLHAPWSRGYEAVFDSNTGFEVESGFRGFLFNKRLMYAASLALLKVTGDYTDMPLLYRLKLGVAYRVF